MQTEPAAAVKHRLLKFIQLFCKVLATTSQVSYRYRAPFTMNVFLISTSFTILSRRPPHLSLFAVRRVLFKLMNNCYSMTLYFAYVFIGCCVITCKRLLHYFTTIMNKVTDLDDTHMDDTHMDVYNNYNPVVAVTQPN